MKQLWLFCPLVLLTCAWGQEPTKMKLREVTWEPFKYKLTWVVEEGTGAGKAFKVKRTRTYVIDFQAATMTDGKRVEKFTEAEADRVSYMFNLLVNGYTQEATEWFVDPEKFERELRLRQAAPTPEGLKL